MPARLATLTMAPPGARCSAAARVRTIGAVRLVVMTFPRSRAECLRIGPRWFSPALLTRMSNRPKRATTRAGSAMTASRSVTSRANAAARSLPSRATCSSSRVWRRATRATRAPARINFSVTERPIPDDAPVTRATRSARSARCGERIAIMTSLALDDCFVTGFYQDSSPNAASCALHSRRARPLAWPGVTSLMTSPFVHRPFRCAAVLAAALAGCGANPTARPNGQAGGGASSGAGGLVVGGNGGGGVNACKTTSAGQMMVKQPVDIILVLDNSGSMADELAAVETNINQNFATILNGADLDYRVILISRHRKDVRAMSGESSTSICVESPLSGLAQCPSPANPTSAPKPIFGPRFFHYNVKIESHDSFETGILAGYHSPDVRTNLTLIGWKEWLRPKTKKVFLELSDDDEGAGDDALVLTVDNFISQLTAMAPEFGTDAQHPNFVFHSIVGLAEKADSTAAYLPDEAVQTAKCTGNGDTVSNAAPTYQELSRRTGGLRFPICQFSGYDVVFRTIANDVITQSKLGCDFAIPPAPAGSTLDLDKVAVKYTKSNGTDTISFGQSRTQADCQSNAFYIQNDRIYLCNDTCNTVQADLGASIEVLFTCTSTIIVR